ncbi:MAG: hypothetical protein J7L45_02655 [Candidatus Aenigmarchaeota archaeon]|nr:hypothetical protein [Candidatus Aenigmarchaeota archaeon]
MFTNLKRKLYERIERKRIEEYESELEKLEMEKAASGETPELLLKEADLLLYSNRFDEALKRYRQILSSNDLPNYVAAEIHERIGNITGDLGHLSKAIEFNEKPEYLYNRAYMALKISKMERSPEEKRKLLDLAEKDITKCLEIEPDFFAHYELRAIVRVNKGNKNGAVYDILNGFKNTYSPEYEGIKFFSDGWKIISSSFDDKIKSAMKSEIEKIKRSKK